jgi:hypothetical protein
MVEGFTLRPFLVILVSKKTDFKVISYLASLTRFPVFCNSQKKFCIFRAWSSVGLLSTKRIVRVRLVEAATALLLKLAEAALNGDTKEVCANKPMPEVLGAVPV